jgi:TonB family protein
MRLLGSVLVSGLIHAGLFVAALLAIEWMAAHAGPVDIDMASSSLLMRVALPSAGRARPAPQLKLWMVDAKGRHQALKPAPQPVTEAAEEETAGAPCPPPCPESAGDWVPAANLGRQPAWTEGQISQEDYPSEMRRGHKEGLVVVDVLIDAKGQVRGTNLVKGSEPDFNNLVVQHLAQSSFSPARDRSGHVVPCRARIPIKFQLN